MHRATPGTLNRRGLTVQSASVRSSIGVNLSDTKPIFSRSIVAEVSGDMVGAFTPKGSSPAVSTNRSASICRAMWMSVFSLKTAVITDRPAMDSERSEAMLPRPLMVCSIGRVTSASTCSGDKPGASVCTSTCGGTKLGNTSSLACAATHKP